MTDSLVIINPRAGGGRSLALWKQLEPYAREKLGNLTYAVTSSPAEVPALIEQASLTGTTRIISMGGDGTNHHVVNAVMQHNRMFPERPLTYAVIPAGTGQDWSRGVRMPLDARKAIDWIADTPLRYVDIGHVLLDGRERFFLNVASIGISSDVIDRVEAARKGGRITFFKAIIQSILFYRPVTVTMEVDDQPWWQGAVYLAAVANGRSFGQGLQVAPNALIDDNRLDVIGAGDMRLPAVLQLLLQLYSGAHLTNPHVRTTQGQTVRITGDSPAMLGVDLDGEGDHAHEIIITVLPRALAMNT